VKEEEGMRISALPRLIRLPNCLLAGLATWVGAWIAGEVEGLPVGLAITTAVLLTGFAMTVNDYYDREIDRINRPDRPIPSGAVSPKEAVRVAAGLAGAGLTTALFTNEACFLVALLATGLAVAYSARIKRTGLPGNAVVAFNTALPFVYGSLATGQLAPLVCALALTAFFATLGREVVKGVADIEGDRALGVRTVAVVWGPGTAAGTAFGFIIAAVVVAEVAALLLQLGVAYVVTVSVAGVGLLVEAGRVLRSPHLAVAYSAKNRMLGWMGVALLGFLLEAAL